MKRIVMVAIIVSVANKIYSQVDESVLFFDYTLAPTGNDGLDFFKTDFGINVPVKLKKGWLKNYMGFGYYQVSYNDDFGFSTSNISKFYDINYGLTYQYPFSDQWFLNTQLKGSIVSNLSNNIGYNDLFLSGELSVTKKIVSRGVHGLLTLGVGYSAITGKPRILPTINYTKSVNAKFSYSIGFPRTFAQYKINDRNTLKSILLLDGFYANLNKSTFVNTTDEVSKASFSNTSLGIEYNHSMDDFWVISFKAGYSLNNNYTLINANENEVFDFNTKSQPFFSTGIKFKFKNNAKKTNYEKQ